MSSLNLVSLLTGTAIPYPISCEPDPKPKLKTKKKAAKRRRVITEESRARQRKWAQDWADRNREKVRASWRAYYARNAEAISADRLARYYAKKAEKIIHLAVTL